MKIKIDIEILPFFIVNLSKIKTKLIKRLKITIKRYITINFSKEIVLNGEYIYEINTAKKLNIIEVINKVISIDINQLNFDFNLEI
ncbi:hypothetical protein [Clostridium perfringens]|uniref:Uncharacterized protein n=1 Tax=Clostridium perfringens TaxID=1502 RepID=A0AAP7BX43_CLOPF|nr:hypothetical protein [Clostridium perfringens]NGU31850.1 hypothetical protein [Clostridium perfringens]HAT4345492.1 hypothetical protein [Clostridium perfringens]